MKPWFPGSPPHHTALGLRRSRRQWKQFPQTKVIPCLLWHKNKKWVAPIGKSEQKYRAEQCYRKTVVGGWARGVKREFTAGGNCAEGGCEPEPEARPLQGSVAGRETQQVHPSHAHSLSHHWLLAFLGRISFQSSSSEL